MLQPLTSTKQAKKTPRTAVAGLSHYVTMQVNEQQCKKQNKHKGNIYHRLWPLKCSCSCVCLFRSTSRILGVLRLSIPSASTWSNAQTGQARKMLWGNFVTLFLYHFFSFKYLYLYTNLMLQGCKVTTEFLRWTMGIFLIWPVTVLSLRCSVIFNRIAVDFMMLSIGK